MFTGTHLLLQLMNAEFINSSSAGKHKIVQNSDALRSEDGK